MQIQAKFLRYEEREFTKKDGTSGTSRLLATIIDGYAVTFGYNNFDEQFNSRACKEYEVGAELALDVVIIGDEFNRNQPRVVIRDIINES